VGWEELVTGFPVIVLEGCDGTGKSTLAEWIAAQYGHTLVRSGRLEDGPDLAARYLAAIEQPGRLVLDRSFVSELVYGSLREGGPRLTADEAAGLAFALEDRGGVLVHLTAHPKALAWRLRVRDGHAPPLDRIRAVLRAYRDVFAGLAGAAPVVSIDTTVDVIKLLRAPSAGVAVPERVLLVIPAAMRAWPGRRELRAGTGH
jgi:thymidylate kinase